jgi:hypothetical protein
MNPEDEPKGPEPMRTDIHAPASAEFNPENYVCLGTFDLLTDNNLLRECQIAAIAKFEAKGYKFAAHNKRGSCQCGHCGSRLRYAGLMLHESNEMIWVGEICLGGTFESTREQFRTLRKQAAAQAKATRELGHYARRISEAVAQEPILAIWEDLEDWNRVSNQYPWFVSDILSKAKRYDLSERQIAAAAKAIRETDAKKAEREAAKGTEKEAKHLDMLPGAKFSGEMVAEVVASFTFSASFGYRSSSVTKIILKTAEGVMLTWQTSSEGQPTRGEKWTLTGFTVKQHVLYKEEIPQTEILRVKYHTETSDLEAVKVCMSTCLG